MIGFERLIRGEGAIAGNARLAELRYVVFDTEFTSLESRNNRLLSIGAVVMEGAKIRLGEQFYREVNPGVEVPSSTVIVHRLRSEDVAHAEDPKRVLADFLRFTEGAIVVGHFVQHDVEIVDKELKRANATPQMRSRARVDTARVFRWNETHRNHYPVEAFDERTIRLDLASVATHYGVTFHEAHHALADAYVTAQIWQKQIAALAARGVTTWRELRKVAK